MSRPKSTDPRILIPDPWIPNLGLGRRALRGGSWNNNQRNARVSYRNHNQPANFNNNNGFRLVVAPDFLKANEVVIIGRR